MPNVNVVILAGHLTRDVEMRYSPGGMAIANVGLAVSRKYKDSKSNEQREEVCFVDCELWGKQAEVANQYLKKGSPVLFEGRLKLDQWTDKASGGKRSKLKVNVESMQFLGSGGGGKKTAKNEDDGIPL